MYNLSFQFFTGIFFLYLSRILGRDGFFLFSVLLLKIFHFQITFFCWERSLPEYQLKKNPYFHFSASHGTQSGFLLLHDKANPSMSIWVNFVWICLLIIDGIQTIEYKCKLKIHFLFGKNISPNCEIVQVWICTHTHIHNIITFYIILYRLE